MFVWGKNDLNPEQEKAIYNENSILLIACPGSGKTRTITYKIAYELSKLESNKQYIVAITYTNRAADEIKERIELLGVDTEQLWIGTIHSFCVEWILKPYHMYIEELRFGYDIINTNDTENYLVSLCASYSTPKKKITYWDCLCYCFTSEGLKINCTKPTIKETVELIIRDYYQNLKEKHEIDYELILYYSYCLLKENKSICKTLSNIFPYILIDEYQDTKELQYMILGAILKTGKENKAFIVGDPNQSIYGNLGGFPMDKDQLESVTGLYYDELSLSNNYRSSSLLVSYFDYFKTYANKIEATGKTKDYQSVISYNKTISIEDLENEIVRIIQKNIDEYHISPNEICILAPQWIHLSGLTRNLMARLPQYSFDGPGMAPFARDIDNFWYKLSRIILTDSTPGLYIRRLRWASEIVTNLISIGVTNIDLSAKQILYICNSILINEQDGLEYLKKFFNAFLDRVNIDINQNKYLKMHYDAFFDSSKKRIERLKKEGAEFITNIDTFRKVFRKKEALDKVMNGCGLKTEKGFIRHPLVFLMEAADSICYLIMDIEDANQKQWLTLDKLKYYINKDENISLDIKNKLMQNTQTTSGNNNYSKKEWVSFRTTLLSHLMEVATNNFVEKLGDIVRGEYNNELIEDNDGVAKLLKYITREYILSNREITSLEITGEAVISGILNAYIKYFFHTNKDFRDRGKSLISRSIFMTILHEHKEAYHDDSYFVQKYGNYQSIEKLYKNFDVADFTVEERFRLIRDFIACMTDKFALNHIRKLNGQKI